LKEAGSDVELYFDSPLCPTQTLDELLQREDIKAVIIALSILVQPDVIRKAMAAGKHILSEKPIAKDTPTARELLSFYQPFSKTLVWAVGENFRFWPAVNKAFHILKESQAELVTFSVMFSTLVDQNDKYFQTEW
jgi:predicted dehydrogenase